MRLVFTDIFYTDRDVNSFFLDTGALKGAYLSLYLKVIDMSREVGFFVQCVAIWDLFYIAFSLSVSGSEGIMSTSFLFCLKCSDVCYPRVWVVFSVRVVYNIGY